MAKIRNWYLIGKAGEGEIYRLFPKIEDSYMQYALEDYFIGLCKKGHIELVKKVMRENYHIQRNKYAFYYACRAKDDTVARCIYNVAYKRKERRQTFIEFLNACLTSACKAKNTEIMSNLIIVGAHECEEHVWMKHYVHIMNKEPWTSANHINMPKWKRPG